MNRLRKTLIKLIPSPEIDKSFPIWVIVSIIFGICWCSLATGNQRIKRISAIATFEMVFLSFHLPIMKGNIRRRKKLAEALTALDASKTELREMARNLKPDAESRGGRYQERYARLEALMEKHHVTLEDDV